jgi:hypothetical protein
MTESAAAQLLCDEKIKSPYLGGRLEVDSI